MYLPKGNEVRFLGAYTGTTASSVRASAIEFSETAIEFSKRVSPLFLMVKDGKNLEYTPSSFLVCALPFNFKFWSVYSSKNFKFSVVLFLLGKSLGSDQ